MSTAPLREQRPTWRRWDDIADTFSGAVDADWSNDRELLDQSVRDPWDRSA